MPRRGDCTCTCTSIGAALTFLPLMMSPMVTRTLSPPSPRVCTSMSMGSCSNKPILLETQLNETNLSSASSASCARRDAQVPCHPSLQPVWRRKQHAAFAGPAAKFERVSPSNLQLGCFAADRLRFHLGPQARQGWNKCASSQAV